MQVPNREKIVLYINFMVCSTLLVNKIAVTLLIHHCSPRHTNTAMAGSSLRRSWSLLDVSRASHTPATVSSASVTDVRVQSGTSNRSTGNTGTSASIAYNNDATARDTIASEEQGLALLGDDAACGDPDGTSGIAVDNSILDYDSEGSDQTSQMTSGTGTHPLSTTMETDFEVAPEESQELDAMYYQCRSARLAGRHDTFVSVTHDSSFGKIVTVQSPQIGSFEDHCNIRGTFYGSRVMRGNAVVN
jgi:hypothetical protein